MKPIFSRSHSEIIASVWSALDDAEKDALFCAVAQTLSELEPAASGPFKFPDAIRVGWAMGFHYAMVCMEAGVLTKTGSSLERAQSQGVN